MSLQELKEMVNGYIALSNNLQPDQLQIVDMEKIAILLGRLEHENEEMWIDGFMQGEKSIHDQEDLYREEYESSCSAENEVDNLTHRIRVLKTKLNSEVIAHLSTKRLLQRELHTLSYDSRPTCGDVGGINMYGEPCKRNCYLNRYGRCPNHQ